MEKNNLLVKAVNKNVRPSHRKLALVCNFIKGKKADPTPAKEAKDFLNNLLVNKKVYIKRITKDRYGRTVGELFKNGKNIQKMIIEKGHGKIYQKYSHQCKWAK